VYTQGGKRSTNQKQKEERAFFLSLPSLVFFPVEETSNSKPATVRVCE
jgi:hypothetical protein